VGGLLQAFVARAAQARNDSTIDDLFQGQYRSVVRCGECGEDSVTFDPFMYLSLPIPPGHRVIELTVVLRPPRRRKLYVRHSRALAAGD
jgi:ubiquitin C-terminal hydrolase